jgi:hypothetical protein
MGRFVDRSWNLRLRVAAVRILWKQRKAKTHRYKYAKFFSRSRDAVIRVYDDARNVIETHEHAGDFKDW